MIFLMKLFGGILSCWLLFNIHIFFDTLSSEHGIDTGIDITLLFHFFIAFVFESEIINIKI